MTDTTAPRANTPWHLWLIGVVLLLWNAIGVYFYWMSVTHDAAYMASMSPEQAALITNAPVWAVAGYAVAVFGSVLGCLLLLLRSKAAVLLFVLALIGYAANALYTFGMSDGLTIVGPGQTGFSAFVFVVMVFQVAYSIRMKKRGVLR